MKFAPPCASWRRTTSVLSYPMFVTAWNCAPEAAAAAGAALDLRARGARSRLCRPVALLVPAVVALLRGRREGDLLHIRRAERSGRVRGACTDEREHGDRGYDLRSR